MINKNGIIRNIDLSGLPKRSDGKINWMRATGYSVPFVYNNIYGDIVLLEYIQEKRTFKIFIDGYTKYQYDTASIDTIKQCQLGQLLHKKIIDTNPEMVKYSVDKDDALRYSCQSNIRTNVHCPFCGYVKDQIIANLYQYGFSCPQCSDGISYPNKLMFNILKQLKVNFKHEVTKRMPGFEWVGKYRYDFYFEMNHYKYFIEMDGHFHKFNRMAEYTKIALADKEKDILALEHNIQMIRIDCCYKDEKTKLSFIKNNILNSYLNTILDLSYIDWNAANQSAITSNIFLAAKYWDNGCSIKQIANQIGVSEDSVTNYLNIAKTLNLCSYNKYDSEKRRVASSIMVRSKPIIVYDHDGTFKIFINASDLSLKSIDIYKIKFNKTSITSTCNKNKTLHGYAMKYITRDQYFEYIEQFQTTQN